MENTPPQWVNGVLYGTGTLSAPGLGTELEAIVRLDVVRMEWAVAFRLERELQEPLKEVRRATLCNVQLHDAQSDQALCIERVEFQDLMGGSPPGRANFAGWAQCPGLPPDAQQKFALLSLGIAEGHVVEGGMEAGAGYGARYQLLRMDGKLAPLNHRQLTLADGNVLALYVEQATDCAYVSVSSAQDWSAHRPLILLALQLFTGVRMRQVQCIQGPTCQLYHHKTHWPPPVSMQHSRQLLGIQVLQDSLARLQQLSPLELERLNLGCQYYLLANANGAVEEIRFTMLMTILELWDGCYTMQFSKTADLLGISESAAELLQELRNKLVHEEGSLRGALPKALKKIFENTKVTHREHLWSCELRQRHLAQLQRDLGLADDFDQPDMVLGVVERLSERIEMAIWNFLGIASQEIQRAVVAQEWPDGVVPVPRAPPVLGPASTDAKPPAAKSQRKKA